MWDATPAADEALFMEWGHVVRHMRWCHAEEAGRVWCQAVGEERVAALARCAVTLGGI